MWVVSARDNYQADISKIRPLIMALADAEVIEEKTSNPENYSRLGVADPKDGGNGYEIALFGPDSSHSVILGDVAQGDFRYARISGESPGYLIDQNPDIPQAAGNWLLLDIIDLDASDIRSVSITHADGENIVVGKSHQEQTDFVVHDIPEGRELTYATVGNGIPAALSKLELQDVRKSIDAISSTTTIYGTWNGLQITAAIVVEDEGLWVAFSAAAIAVGTVAEPANKATSESENHGTAVSEAIVPKSLADEINAHLSGWQYQIPEHKMNLLMRRWDDILQASDSE